jgi:hypothetical protein
MKTLKIVGLSLLLVLLPILAYAGPVELWSVGANKSFLPIIAPSQTAAIAFTARPERVAWTVNDTHATYDVYLSTWAVTATNIAAGSGSYYKLLATKDYKEDTNPYTGTIYIVCPSGTTTIYGEERWR